VDIPICAAENVEGFKAKGILISPMYIYNKNAAALWGVGGVCNLKLCELVGTDHCLLSHYSDNA
jgi:hypothetical protein